MSAGRLVLVLGLGVATFLATQESPEHRPEAPRTAPLVPASSPVAMTPPFARPRLHPVPALHDPPEPAPAIPSATESRLVAHLDQVTRRLNELGVEIEKLNQWRLAT